MWGNRYFALILLRMAEVEQHVGDALVAKAWERRRGKSTLTFRQAYRQSRTTQQASIIEKMSMDLTQAMGDEALFDLMTEYHQTYGTYNFTTHDD